ncbi:MAG: ABC transporter ATP-binding protein [Planctomycetales bacterium]|nr:ABC transporter ATP-binding protein [Planctomycetales bacterium]
MNSVDPVIQLCGVRKSYRRGTSVTDVLCGVDFTVHKGECVFVAGPSGCGKSTLLSIIGAMLSADAGSTKVLGCDLATASAAELSRFRLTTIGFVFQRFQLIRGLSVIDNVCVPMTIVGRKRKDARSTAGQLLDVLGIGDKRDESPANLSMGQCQRVAIARALANDPELILADEPTASLDAASGLNVVQILRELAKQMNRTVVVITHDSRIFPYADRICRLENGVFKSAPPDVPVSSSCCIDTMSASVLDGF